MVHFEGVFTQWCYFSSSAAFLHQKIFPVKMLTYYYTTPQSLAYGSAYILVKSNQRNEQLVNWFYFKNRQQKCLIATLLKCWKSTVSILNPEREKKDKPWFASIKEQLGMSVCVMISWHFCLHFCIVYKVMYRRLKGERMFPSICYVSIHKCLWDQQKGCYCYNQLNCTNNVQVRPKLNMFYDVLIEQGKLRYPMSDLNYLTFSDSLS